MVHTKSLFKSYFNLFNFFVLYEYANVGLLPYACFCSGARSLRMLHLSLAGLWRHPGGCISSAETGHAGDAHRARALLAGGQSPDDPCLCAGGDGRKLCQLENDWDTPLLQVSPARSPSLESTLLELQERTHFFCLILTAGISLNPILFVLMFRWIKIFKWEN